MAGVARSAGTELANSVAAAGEIYSISLEQDRAMCT